MPYVNPITQPYGDIAMMPTNKLDSAVNRIYAENKQREAKKAAELAAIDDDMNKEYGNIRSIDVPEFTEKWSKYKQLRQKVLYDKNLQKDPIAYQQAKRDADMALGEVYRHGNASKEVLQAEKNKDEWAKSHPYETSNDYDKHRLALRNTKVNDINNYQIGVDEKGQPIKRSLLDESLYVDNTPTYDWAKRAKEAEGVLNKGVYEERKALDKQGLQFEVVQYNYGATPEQFRLTLRSSLTDGDPKKNQSALKTASKLGAKISPQDYEAIQQQYLSIPPDELKRRGIKQLNPLPTPENDADRYINFATMQNALARNAVRGESREKDNEAAKMNMKFALDKKLKEYEHDLKAMDENKQGIWVDNYIKNTLVKNAAIRDINVADASEVNGFHSLKDIKMSPIESKALVRDGQTPDRLKYDEKTNTFIPVYFQYEKDDKSGTMKPKVIDGQYVVNADLSVPLTYEQFKISLIDAAPKNTQTVREMNRDVNIGGGKREIQSSTRSTSQSGATGKKAIPNF